MNDYQLHGRLLARDEGVFAEVINSYSKLLWVLVSGILCPGGSKEDIEECVSDVFCQLWANPQKYQPERGSLKSYLCIVAKSKALNMRRNQSNNHVIYLDGHQGEPAYEDMALSGQADYSTLYAAVSSLGQPTKEILVRRYFHGETPAQISTKMDLPKKEIENRLYRGKRALRAILSENQEVL